MIWTDGLRCFEIYSSHGLMVRAIFATRRQKYQVQTRRGPNTRSDDRRDKMTGAVEGRRETEGVYWDAKEGEGGGGL